HPQCQAVMILSCERRNRAGLDGDSPMADARTPSRVTTVSNNTGGTGTAAISKRFIALTAAALLLAACSGSHPTFRILAGSEEKTFQPIVQDYCEQMQVTCAFYYKGSLDIGLALSSDETPNVDAVWPASSVWLDIYDVHHRVKNLKSIASTPVILG